MNIKNTTFLLVAFTLNSCMFSDNRLNFINNSTHNLVVALSVGSLPKFNNLNFYLRDTINRAKSKVFGIPSGIHRDGWSLKIRNSDNKKLSFYIIKYDTLVKYKNTHEIIDLINLKKIDTIITYSEAQLDSINWEVKFNPK